MDLHTYTTQCVELARSIRIFHKTVAKQLLHYYRLNRPGWIGCTDIEDSPYVRHLRGLPALTDEPLTMTSVDTGLPFTLTTDFTAHPKTRQRLMVDHKFFMETALSLGETGYGRLMGLVYPYTGPIDLRNGTIIGYNEALVEPQEFDLINAVQDWIYRSLKRWTNSGYIASDELYGAAIHGILYAHLPSYIMHVRNRNVLTQKTHTFHINSYLIDHGYGDAVNLLTPAQKYSLYRQVPWLIENAGTQAAYAYYKRMLEMDPTVSINEFWTQIDPIEETVSIVRSNFGTNSEVSVQSMSTLTGQSKVDIHNALTYGEVVDTLPTISVQVRGHYGIHLPLKRALLYAWGSYANRNIYVDTLQVELPDGTTRALTTKDAFKYYTVHRSMAHMSSAYDNDIYVLPFIQVVNGFTGMDLFNFIDISRIDRKQFPEYVEQMHFDMMRLRMEIDLTPTNERVYWEGEFPRTYPILGALIPNKTEWLTENDLPELTDEYLDKMFEVFTGYSLTQEAKTLNKAKSYRSMLRKVLSASAHITNELDIITHMPFVQCAPVGVLDIVQIP